MNNETTVVKDIHNVLTKWDGKMHFESLINDHIIHLDKLAKNGGDDTGPRPKPLILAAVGGCIGMEIINIIDKMRLKIDALEIDVNGELTEGQPKMYKSVDINIKIKCLVDDRTKIEKAIHLAVDKYCGVVAMLQQFATVTSEILYL